MGMPESRQALLDQRQIEDILENAHPRHLHEDVVEGLVVDRQAVDDRDGRGAGMLPGGMAEAVVTGAGAREEVAGPRAAEDVAAWPNAVAAPVAAAITNAPVIRRRLTRIRSPDLLAVLKDASSRNLE